MPDWRGTRKQVSATQVLGQQNSERDNCPKYDMHATLMGDPNYRAEHYYMIHVWIKGIDNQSDGLGLNKSVLHSC